MNTTSVQQPLLVTAPTGAGASAPPLAVGDGTTVFVEVSTAGAVTLNSAPGQDINLNAGAGGTINASGGFVFTFANLFNITLAVPPTGTVVVPTAQFPETAGAASFTVHCLGDGATGSNAAATFALASSGAVGFADRIATVADPHGRQLVMEWPAFGRPTIGFDGVGAPYGAPTPASVTCLYS